MLRAVLAVVVGYVAIVLFIIVTFSLAYLIMGAEGAFEPGSYEVTLRWLIVSFILGFFAAVLGGIICGLIARNRRVPLVLGAIVLLLGLGMAGLQAAAPDEDRPTVREGDVGNIEAMQDARQPAVALWLNPFVGAVGVYLGSRLKRAPKPA